MKIVAKKNETVYLFEKRQKGERVGEEEGMERKGREQKKKQTKNTTNQIKPNQTRRELTSLFDQSHCHHQVLKV